MKYYCPNTGKHIPFNIVEGHIIKSNYINGILIVTKQCNVVKNCPFCGKKHEFKIGIDWD